MRYLEQEKFHSLIQIVKTEIPHTAWKVSKYGVFFWSVFGHFLHNVISNIHVNKPQTSNYFLRYTWYFILDISYYFVREGSSTFTQKFTISLKGDIVLRWRPCLTEMITDIFCVFFQDHTYNTPTILNNMILRYGIFRGTENVKALSVIQKQLFTCIL